MSTGTAVTMQDLELEHAELLPSRETLCAPYGCRPHCYHPCYYHTCYYQPRYDVYQHCYG
jgi:hypothetical protein